MRSVALVLLVISPALLWQRVSVHARKTVDFRTDIQPILERKCQPCHFAGGKMYDKLPFDRGATVVQLGTTRLFTRIKDESERALIRDFIAQQPGVTPPRGR